MCRKKHDLEELLAQTCNTCNEWFETMQGLMAHQSMSKKCSWYKKGKLKAIFEPSPEQQAKSSSEFAQAQRRQEVSPNTFREKLGLSYHNMRALLQKVDSMPARAEWKEEWLTFKDRPGEHHLVQFRDVIEAIRALLGNPAHADRIVCHPSKLFSSSACDNRIYTEMWTGKWWHALQSLLPEGSALAPVIISTDKTQLTQFSGNKSAYPVYMTLGNIPKDLRRKPSEHVCMLIGYLSVDKIDSTGLTDRKHRALVQKLFHKSVQLILEPLIEAGKEGIDVTGGDGKVRRVHPVLAVYVADYPEQCLVTCSKYGTCPICQCPNSALGEEGAQTPRRRTWTLDVLRLSRSKGQKGSNAFIDACQNLNVSGYVVEPFWKEHTLADIHLSITPDVLHQLYQGVFKHVLEWCSEAMDEKELDQRIRCLPPVYGTRHFKNGISALSQVSGSERKDMARILLGCLVGRIPCYATTRANSAKVDSGDH
ncbi:hypothetical protein C8Q72DRAFT_786477 [Fomitopsis betulina]|nr:hypothetical protein C8Q72DRAFT_786477 [Fomitopsis betulina]